MNAILTFLAARAAALTSAFRDRAGTLDDLMSDAQTLRARVVAIIDRNNAEVAELEAEIETIETTIESLDDETDRAETVRVGLSRLLGEG